jgi:hypothetical protein
MGIITERDSVADGYPAAASPGSASAAASSDVTLHRPSALPSRRCVLYVLCERDAFVAEDLVAWYTERGFHFYIADLRPKDQIEPAEQGDRQDRRRQRTDERLARLDAACAHLRGSDGIDMIVASAHSAGALTAALWCHARRGDGVVDALILSGPAAGRKLRRGLEIACPVLVMSPGNRGRVSRLPIGPRRGGGSVRLGPHVTWLRLGQPGEGAAADDRKQFFDELGRWLGAYMYGRGRDQLL